MDLGGNYINALTNSFIENKKFDDFKAQAETLKISGAEQERKIAEASKEFESLFIGQLYRLMFETVEIDSLFGGGHTEETFRSMLIDEYGKITAQTGGIGISDDIQRSLMNMNEK